MSVHPKECVEYDPRFIVCDIDLVKLEQMAVVEKCFEVQEREGGMKSKWLT
jgi:hypothetical protein